MPMYNVIQRMKSMLMHSFVLDALETTGADTFSHFEMLIDEHIRMTDKLNAEMQSSAMHHLSPSNVMVQSRLKQLVPSVGTFYTRLPLRKAFDAYNAKVGCWFIVCPHYGIDVIISNSTRVL